jgi:hypothetical protein
LRQKPLSDCEIPAAIKRSENILSDFMRKQEGGIHGF